MREVDNIKSCQDKMKRTLEQVNHQLGVNRNTRHQIERDLANKDHSSNIDHTCHNLQNTSREYRPLIGQYKSRDLNTELLLVQGHQPARRHREGGPQHQHP